MPVDVIVEREVDAVVMQLEMELGFGSADDLRLIPGEVIRLIAEKVVLPVVAAFISEVLRTRWKEARSKPDRAAVKKAILGSVPARTPATDLDIVRQEAIACLTGEGVSPEIAQRVVNAAIVRVRAALYPGEAAPPTD